MAPTPEIVTASDSAIDHVVRVLSVLGLALWFAGGALGQTVTLHAGVKRSPGNAQVLQAALERSLAGRAPVEFLGEGAPCDHTGALMRDLQQLAVARSFQGMRNHTFALIRHDGNLLDVEQLGLRSEADAQRMASRLAKGPLAVTTKSGATTYEFLRRGRMLVLFVAPYRGWTPETRALVDTIKKNYEAAAAGNQPPGSPRLDAPVDLPRRETRWKSLGTLAGSRVDWTSTACLPGTPHETALLAMLGRRAPFDAVCGVG